MRKAFEPELDGKTAARLEQKAQELGVSVESLIYGIVHRFLSVTNNVDAKLRRHVIPMTKKGPKSNG